MTEENPIIEEIRRTREVILGEYHGDLDSLITALQRSSEARAVAGRPMVAPARRKKDDNHASNAKKVG